MERVVAAYSVSMGFSGDVPVGAQREADALVGQNPECIRGFDPFGADAPFGPASVIYRMVRLDGRNHLQRREPVEIRARDVLRVLDAEPPIAIPVALHNVLEEVENLRDARIANRVYAELQSGAISRVRIWSMGCISSDNRPRVAGASV